MGSPDGDDLGEDDEDEEPASEDKPGDDAAAATCELPAGGAAALGALSLGQLSRAPRVSFLDDEEDWLVALIVS